MNEGPSDTGETTARAVTEATTTAATILQVVPELDAGGAELSTIEVAEAIVRAGGVALVATAGGRMADAARQVGAEVIEMPLASKNPLTMATNARRLRSLVAERGVGLVHARSRAPAWSARWAARKACVPFVTTYHGAYSENGPIKRAYNRVMASGDVVIANSDYTARLVRERYDTEPKRIVVINRGMDHARFDPASVSRERTAAMRLAWGVPDGAAIVLHPARLTRWKGQAVTIDAMAALARMGGAPAHLVLAGDAQGRDDYRDGLVAQIARLGLSQSVHLVGNVVDMPAAFAISDVVIIASIEPEAFGRTSAEAQSMGVPVIATRLGAPQDTVKAEPGVDASETTGWLVPPGDADAMAAAIHTALSEPAAARRARSERAMRHARATYSTLRLQRETLAVYDRLLATELAATFASRG